MKKLFTLSFLALLTVQISFAQDLEPGFYPPEGSTFNEDSSVVTIPSAYLESNYSDTIVFYVSETFSVDLGGETLDLPFNFAQITNVVTPNGMEYSCNADNCYFEPNTSGEVILSGTPTDLGIHQLDLTAFVSIDATPLGFIGLDIEFDIPYTGGNALLDIALAGDYSVLNDVVPTFLIGIEPAENNPNLEIEDINSKAFDNLVLYPNPASSEASFTFYNSEINDLDLQIYDLLGNLIYCQEFKGLDVSEQTITINTSSFNNGVYIYKLSSTLNKKRTGRLVVSQ